MKDFLKDKPKETFDKAPKMPEDIRELYLQRQREMNEERSNTLAEASKGAVDKTMPAIIVEPKLEQITLPPAAGEGLTATTPAEDAPKKAEPSAPKVNTPRRTSAAARHAPARSRSAQEKG